MVDNLMIFNRDLRLSHNPALFEANKKSCLCVFIWPNHIGNASKAWLYLALEDLNGKLDNKLQIFDLDIYQVLNKLFTKHGFKEIFINQCYDEQEIYIEKFCKLHSVKLNKYNSNYLIDPMQLNNKTGDTFKIYKPFYNASRNLIDNSNIHTTCKLKTNLSTKYANSLHLNNDNKLEKLKYKIDPSWLDKAKLHRPTEQEALNKLDQFVQNSAYYYGAYRNFPNKNITSNLSAYLHFGQITPYQIIHHLNEVNCESNEIFLQELFWREFANYTLVHNPSLRILHLRAKFFAFPWDYSVQKDREFALWTKGLTGFPIIDAGMRELFQTGLMHNRIRMITASFLAKNLLIDWRIGENWFWNNLFDADAANNGLNWQWVAGSGIDSAPYFRVFNPILQSKKFDCDGIYIKKYVIELQNVDHRLLHDPDQIPSSIGYISPIVNLKDSRIAAINAWKSLNDTNVQE